MTDEERKITGVCVDIPNIIAEAKEDKRIISVLEQALGKLRAVDEDGSESSRS